MTTRMPNDPKSKGAAYSTAVKRLHDAHRAELEQYLVEEYKTRGFTYKRRLTDAEREANAAEAKRASARQRIAKIAKDAGLEALVQVPGQTTIMDALIEDEVAS